MDFNVEPSPQINISYQNPEELPITDFQLILMVEPDPETYMIFPEDHQNLSYLLRDMQRVIEWELDPDRVYAKDESKVTERYEPAYVWIRYFDDVSLYGNIADYVSCDVTINLMVYDLLDHLKFYLQGVYSEHPDWKVGVFGAVIEDDVINVANLSQETGFSTTVLTRYCISNKAFANLDDLYEYDTWVRNAGRKENEPYISWYEEWLKKHDHQNDDRDEDSKDFEDLPDEET